MSDEDWSEHFDSMAEEIDRIKRQASTEDITVSTTMAGETRIALLYDNPAESNYED